MSEQVFRSGYADQYDLLYREKDYEAECDLVEEMFRRHGDGQIHTILDLGCGTGGHAIPLTKRGYELVGIDHSPEMLALARRKLEEFKLEDDLHLPTFLQGDVRTLDLGQSFDAILMMFAVLSYQRTNDDVLAALRTVRQHLRPGGLFLADVWYGPAVLGIGPSDRIKILELEDGQLIRTASATLEVLNHLCVVHYNMWRLEGKRLVSHTREDHVMRFFFPLELEHYFNLAKMDLIGLHPFPNFTDQVDTNTWNVLICGRAVT